MSFRFASPIVFSVSLFATLTLAASARAECTANSDCPDGTTCEVVGGSGCITPDIDCPEGEKCEQPADTCEPEEIKGCVPAECDADADCGDDGLICMQQSYQTCTGGGEVPACAPNEDCAQPEPAEESCETVTEAYCAPRWIGSCEVAADCGAGFTCEESESCGCSGSAGGADPGAAGGASGTEPEPAPEDSCSCEPTGVFYCKLTERECSDATECPADWSCETGPDEGVCTSGPDGAEPECTEPDTTKLCFPPNWDLVNGGNGGVIYAQEDDASSSGSGEPTRGVAEPVEDADSNQAASGSNSSTDSDAGCAIAPATGRSTTGLGAALGLLGLGLLARRRRDASAPNG